MAGTHTRELRDSYPTYFVLFALRAGVVVYVPTRPPLQTPWHTLFISASDVSPTLQTGTVLTRG